MKIQCDGCHKEKASLFCPSDEAALCHDCDHTIHHANKLAGKHKRFYLLHPTSKDSPLCDICRERRAYLFCQEDRAILCRECDLTIHGVNEHTKKHNRLLLTGVKLGAIASPDPTSLSSNGTATDSRATGSEVGTTRSTINRSSSFSNENTSSCLIVELEDNMACVTGSVSTSSISEYLIETIPGYCMEDLFDASFAPNFFCKDYEHQLEFQDQDLQVNMCSSFPLQAWVPQSQVSTWNVPKIDSLVGVMEMPQRNKATEGYSNWRYNGFTSHNVSSIGPPLNDVHALVSQLFVKSVGKYHHLFVFCISLHFTSICFLFVSSKIKMRMPFGEL